jgi:hypothetical protein
MGMMRLLVKSLFLKQPFTRAAYLFASFFFFWPSTNPLDERYSFICGLLMSMPHKLGEIKCAFIVVML